MKARAARFDSAEALIDDLETPASSKRIEYEPILR